LQSELGNVTTGQGDVLHAGRDHISVTDREDMSYTITGVDDSAGHFGDVVEVGLLVLVLLA